MLFMLKWSFTYCYTIHMTVLLNLKVTTSLPSPKNDNQKTDDCYIEFMHLLKI